MNCLDELSTLIKSSSSVSLFDSFSPNDCWICLIGDGVAGGDNDAEEAREGEQEG